MAEMRAVLLAHTQVVPEGLSAIGYTMHAPGEMVEPADELAEAAGRLCYKSWSRPNPKTATSEGYLGHILEVGHESVLEHATATIYFDGVSRTLTHEFVRHRHLSPSQVSQRYVDEGAGNMVFPPVLEEPGNERLREILEHHHLDSLYVYEQIEQDLRQRYPHKVARGAARAALIGAHETAIIMTGNMRAWRYVVRMRNSPAADDEIRQLAGYALSILRALAPNTFQDFEE